MSHNNHLEQLPVARHPDLEEAAKQIYFRISFEQVLNSICGMLK